MQVTLSAQGSGCPTTATFVATEPNYTGTFTGDEQQHVARNRRAHLTPERIYGHERHVDQRKLANRHDYGRRFARQRCDGKLRLRHLRRTLTGGGAVGAELERGVSDRDHHGQRWQRALGDGSEGFPPYRTPTRLPQNGERAECRPSLSLRMLMFSHLETRGAGVCARRPARRSRPRVRDPKPS